MFLKSLGMVSIIAAPVLAAPTVFQGNDAGANSLATAPNSVAAAAAFDTALGLGRRGVLTFEGLPTGFVDPLAAAPGVTIDYSGGWQAASTGVKPNGTFGATSGNIYGYNTTVGGNLYLSLLQTSGNNNPGMAEFIFDTPIDSWGGYFAGIGSNPGGVSVIFNDGTSRTYNLPTTSNGGTAFFGFVGADLPITSVTIRQQGSTADFFGVDDIRYGSIPEPTTLATLAAAGLLLRRRR